MSAAAQLRALLFQFWKPQPFALSAPLCCEAQAEAGGVAGLLYWRLREAAPLSWKAHYQLEALRMSLQEAALVRCARLLREHKIRALLGKGWSVARHYPTAGLRPCGDIDLYVDPPQYEDAKRLLVSDAVGIDVHRGCLDLAEYDFEQLWQRSETVSIAGEPIVLFGRDDLLQLVIAHAVRHGMTRPIWLCDVAILYRISLWNVYEKSQREGAPSGFRTFNSEFFYTNYGDSQDRNNIVFSSQKASWLRAILALAYKWLGMEGFAEPLPAWVEACVSRAWETPYHVRLPLLAQSSLREFCEELPRHWPNEIEASVFLGEAWQETSKLHWQPLSFLVRAGQAARHWARMRFLTESRLFHPPDEC